MVFIYYLAIILFLLLCAILCLVILVQESKSSGLGSSFGGDAQESVFGTAAADVLKKITSWMGFAFLVGCLLLSFWTASLGRSQKAYIPFNLEKSE